MALPTRFGMSALRRLAPLLLAVVAGCGGEAQEPPRVLAPSIRAQDLVTWLDEGAVDGRTLDWAAIDAAHDRYLVRALADRIVARDRITELYRTFDGDASGHVPSRERWNAARSSAAIARDFEAMIARQDEALLNELVQVPGMNGEISAYLIARRSLDRIAQRFALARTRTNVTARYPNAIDAALKGMRGTPAPDPAALRAFVRESAQRLVPIGDQWWDNTVKATLLILEGAIPPSPKTLPEEAQASARVLNTEASAIVVASASECVRAELAVFERAKADPHTPLTRRAIDDGVEEVFNSLARPGAVSDLDKAFTIAHSLDTGSDATRRQVESMRLAWRQQWNIILNTGEPNEVTEKSVDAAMRTKVRLLALFPAATDKARINGELQEDPPPPPPVDPADAEAAETYADVSLYANWVNAALAPPAPTREVLRTVARMARLDRSQEDLFVEDARHDWTAALIRLNTNVREAEETIGPAIEYLGDPKEFERLLTVVMTKCIEGPLAAGAAVDDAIAESLALRADAFHGRSEPAASLYRMYRVLPPPPRAWETAGHNEVRCFGAVARGSAAELALDRELGGATQAVLVDLIVEHRDELVQAAAAAIVARSTLVRAGAAVLVAHRDDPARAKDRVRELTATFFQQCEPWTDLQATIVDRACELLSEDECEQLRYRRAQSRFPEILGSGASSFAVDGRRARELAGEALVVDDAALDRALRADDLALVAAIEVAIARRPGGQPSLTEVNRLAITDEALVEQSRRRIDRAVRAKRDLDLRSTTP